jgi:hypothetical protein
MAVSTIKEPQMYKRWVSGSDIGANDNLITLNVLPSNGIYFLITSAQEQNTHDLCSIYTFRRAGTTLYKQSTIYEGTDNNAPRIGTDGKITKKDGGAIASNSVCIITAIKIQAT